MSAHIYLCIFINGQKHIASAASELMKTQAIKQFAIFSLTQKEKNMQVETTRLLFNFFP